MWSRSLLALVLTGSIALSLGAAYLFRPHGSLFDLSNFVGPTTRSLLHGQGLTMWGDLAGTHEDSFWIRSARMPVASGVVALGIKLFGLKVLRVELFKTLLLVLPVELAILLVWRERADEAWKQGLTAALLLVPFAMTSFLADVANLQVEEGYSYSLLALATALLLYVFGPGRRPAPGWVIVFALATAGVYLAKSSMVLVTAVLLVSFLALERRHALRAVAVVLVLAAPVGWALRQHHASGRYTIGTSLDGINLHKGNATQFLGLYPPAPGETLDAHDADLSRGLRFPDEWAFNDYHQKAAVTFMRTHPAEALDGDARKLEVIFLSVHKLGSSSSSGLQLRAEVAGLVIFRLIFWTAICLALWAGFRPRSKRASFRALSRPESARAAGLIFLGLVLAVAVPYTIGFAYTRHVSVLIYPSVLLCCRFLAGARAIPREA